MPQVKVKASDTHGSPPAPQARMATATTASPIAAICNGASFSFRMTAARKMLNSGLMK
ncbi:hypothetical protein D3C78_1990560 [compost metagenome]